MAAPLDNITIVEIDNWMASPSAGAILADLGANVIKIEPITGDPMRGNGRPPKIEGSARDYDYQFDVDNRGKHSILVDLVSAEGQAVVRRLVEHAQIFMCNLLPARQEKFGLDPDSLFKVNPGIVHATLTGYGTTGPDAWRPGYDVTAFFGRSGIYDAMREGTAGDVPMARPAQGDHCTGLAFTAAILAALRLAENTGKGQAVETSLYETAVWSQASDYATTVIDKAPVRQRARHELLLPTANRYPCGDGKWVVFNMPEASAWPKLCKALGRDDWLADENLQTPKDRYQRMAELVPAIDATLATKSRDEWGAIFDAAGLIWGPVLALHEVAADPQADAIGLFPVINDETIGDYRTVNIPMRFRDADVGPRGRSPRPGEHTISVLADAGFDQVAISSMLDSGTVA